MSSLVSIVIPVYNAERYLADCLESVIRQSYPHLEIILVNDGSTDGSGLICEEYARKDARVRYCSQRNHGVSYSRNYGVSIGKGTYIVFVDSDDVCHADMVKKLVSACEKNRSDMAVCGIRSFSGAPEHIRKIFHEDTREIDISTFLHEIVLRRQSDIYVGGPYNKLFRKEIIDSNSLRFIEDAMFAEDFMFALDYFRHCRNVAIVGDELYYYRTNSDNSLTYRNYHNYDFQKAWLARERAYDHWERFFDSFHDAHTDVGRVSYLMVSFMVSMFYAEVNSLRPRAEVKENIRSLIKNAKCGKRVRQSKGVGFHEKLKVFLCKYKLVTAIRAYAFLLYRIKKTKT